MSTVFIPILLCLAFAAAALLTVSPLLFPRWFDPAHLTDSWKVVKVESDPTDWAQLLITIDQGDETVTYCGSSTVWHRRDTGGRSDTFAETFLAQAAWLHRREQREAKLFEQQLAGTKRGDHE